MVWFTSQRLYLKYRLQIIGHSVQASISTLRSRKKGRHCADDIFKWIFLNENVGISLKISLNFVANGLINNIPALARVMAWCRSDDEPLSEPIMVNLLTHICVTRLQWVNNLTHQICHRYEYYVLLIDPSEKWCYFIYELPIFEIDNGNISVSGNTLSTEIHSLWSSGW